MVATNSSLRTEDGAVAVVTALTLTVLLLFAAFVIDFGAARADRAAGQLIADMSAAAAVQDYEPTDPGSSQDACRQAIAYAGENLGIPLSADGDGCLVFPAGERCDTTVVRRANYSSSDGRITVTVINPVPHGIEGDGLMQDVVYPSVDGTDCERIGVRVQQSRDFLLARAGGSDVAGVTTSMSAVGVTLGGERASASLIVLDPEGCRTLRTDGSNARIDVLRGANDEPGIITVDTRSDCKGQNQTVFDPGPNSPAIRAADQIFSNALRFGDPNIGNESPQIQPQPVAAGPPVTRYLIDTRYNCLSTYPDTPAWSPETWHPQYTLYPDSGAVSCESSDDNSSDAPYLQLLHDATMGALDSTTWGVIDDCSTDATYGPGAGAEDAGGDGTKFFVDCNSFTPTGATFVDATHIVVEGTISLSGTNAALTVEQGNNAVGTVLVSRTGGIDASRPLILEDTFVYLAGTGNAAIIDYSGGAVLEWNGIPFSRAVDGVGNTLCQTGPPNAACFAPLALWANAPTGNNNRMRLVGGSEGFVQGTFFTPNAELRLSGSSGEPKLEFRGAQFFARELDARGGAAVELVPNEDSQVDTTEVGKSIIR